MLRGLPAGGTPQNAERVRSAGQSRELKLKTASTVKGGSVGSALFCAVKGGGKTMWNCDWEYENQEKLKHWYEEKNLR